MPTHTAPGLAVPALSQNDHNFVPDFAIAGVGGLVALGVCALLYAAIVTWGGFRLDLAVLGGVTAPLSALPRELAAIFLSAALVVLVARSLTARGG